MTKKIKTRKFKSFNHEAVALVEFMLNEAVARGQSMAYRLKIPYKSVATADSFNDGDLIVEVKVMYDGEFKEEPDEQPKTYKVTGPSKDRH